MSGLYLRQIADQIIGKNVAGIQERLRGGM
jgi:hypothetical protein